MKKMKKLKMSSPDLVEKNIKEIAELFPNCLTESVDEQGQAVQRIDFDLLQQELSGTLVEGPEERFRLDWPGKRQALLTANCPIAKTLRPDRESSVNFDTTGNIYIEGDNLDALKLLQENYLGKVKMIYIDPPYNTGNDFIYKDDFAEDREEYFQRSHQKDEDGNRLVANTEANGRFHSDWLSMMYSRLKLARNLLRDDGVIFISIDDNELTGLRKICDELFGASNFIACIIWHKMDSPKNTAMHFSVDHDYILVYSKSSKIWRPNLLPRTQEMLARYQNPDNDSRGPWLLSDLAARNFYAQGQYSITTKTGREIKGPPPGSYWRVSKEKFAELENDNRIWWGVKGDNRPGIKRFLSEVKSGVVPQTYWPWQDVGSTRHSKRDFNILMEYTSGEEGFITPKPVKLLIKILRLSTEPNSNDIIVDFFAGSSATAHAVMQLNSEDGGNRRFILVQLPEATESTQHQTIAEIGRERIRRSGQSILQKLDSSGGKDLTLFDGAAGNDGGDHSAPLDIGFRAFKIDSTCMADVYYNPDDTRQDQLGDLVGNIKPDRTDEDLLFQIIVDWGLDLSLPLERRSLAGTEVLVVDGNALAVCFAEKINEDLVKQLAGNQPPFLRVVFRDSSFPTDDVQTNLYQIFKQLSPSTEIKVI